MSVSLGNMYCCNPIVIYSLDCNQVNHNVILPHIGDKNPPGFSV
jgi:hypothetical protein